MHGAGFPSTHLPADLALSIPPLILCYNELPASSGWIRVLQAPDFLSISRFFGGYTIEPATSAAGTRDATGFRRDSIAFGREAPLWGEAAIRDWS